MLIVSNAEGFGILNGEKVSSLRAIRESGKGYLTKNSLQWICIGRDFVNGLICRVLILRRSFVNIEDLTLKDFQSLGYSSKAEYMEQPYNRKNPSLERVRYDFITLADLLRLVQSLDICPANFFYIWDMVGNNKELSQGVDASLIYEGCDLADLESAFMTIESNIEEANNDQ